jgi:hypothetical protein
MSLITTHNAGFFSCCSVKLMNITDYINKHLKLPTLVDSSRQFEWYKNSNRDITYDYFEHYDHTGDIAVNKINYHESYQFHDYSTLDPSIFPVMKKYFTPSKNILHIIEKLENKYNLTYDNLCVLFYRGNDKIRETKLCDYNEYLKYAKEVLTKNPNVVFLIQSDETEFIEYMSQQFPNSFYFRDEIRHMKKCNSTVDYVFKDKNNEFSKYYLAITIIMSKCKYIICGSGNCSIWIILYRGHHHDVYQNINHTWLIHGCGN